MEHRRFYYKLAAVFLVAVSILTFFYARLMRGEIEKNVLKAISETARHDMLAIKAFVEFYLDNLGGVEKRLTASGATTLPELREQLKLESETTRFSGLFLLEREGGIFDDPGFASAGALAGMPEFKAARSLVFRAGGEGDFLAFALRLDNFRVGDAEFDALVGLADVGSLRDFLIIYSFVRSGEAHGFSSIIDEAGNFIVGGPGGLGGQSGNFFTRLAGADAPWTKREIQKKMREEETFHFYMEDNAGENLVYLAPFKAKGVNATDWYFLMSVDNGYLEKSGGTVLILSAALPSLAILLMLGMMIYGAVAHHQTRAAREAARTRANFLSHMSHEIRTPLNGVIGLNHLITKNIGDPEKAPQIKAWLAKSRFLAEYLLSLLDDVLDMSRLKAGGLAPRHEKFSIAKMNSDLVYMREADAESRDIRLILHQKLPWPKAIGDEERTRGVLTNILDNAIKFTGAGGTITLKVAQKKLKDSRVLTTWICSDTGQGISPDFLEKIFEPFAREARVRGKSPLSGAGLGLPISRELVLSMGGEISARSVVGEGTEVTVKIPFERASGEEDDERPESRDASRADGLKALLAEDAEFNAEFLLDVLADAGFETTLAPNGKEAVEKFAASAPGEYSVILMDMEMPVMDGCEAARTIRAMDREDAKTVFIIACTANAFQDDKERAMESGMDDFLTKPVDIEKFLKKIREKFRAPKKTGGEQEA